MNWQKPELITDRERIAWEVLRKDTRRCWAKVVLWFTFPEFHDFEEINFMSPQKCGYCGHCMDESERQLSLEEYLATSEGDNILDVLCDGEIYAESEGLRCF
uniref:Uncharacterized protein n=1 Tax=viral metagenome TaxID=1070528 RepID=A0A6M3JN15_9ZZZZ